MQVNKVNNTSFRAIHLASAEARCKGVLNAFDLYKTTERDYSYLEKMSSKINLRELMPNLKEEDYMLWERIKGLVLSKGLIQPSQTLLLLKQGKLCGGLKYSFNRLGYSVDAQATWPIEKNQREPFAGKTLMLGFYNMFMKDSFNTVRACVARHNPFSTISKCMELGFSSVGGDDYNEVMATNRSRIQQTLEKFAPIISFMEDFAGEDIDLETLK